jgi:HD-GYP domain-containing protein (c-di-GMP phosphodiesterase class II)
VPDDIIQVAYQHHEDCLAHGYPRRLKKSEIHPFARIIYLVDLFCNYTINGPHSEGVPAKEAIAKIEVFHKEEVDEALFSALKSCLTSANKAAA